ncbi:MAG: hypothetical protein IKP71_04040 [Candidatus Riflebacteria bacterium]|nr:hypothetical protein [Candidatus Riflebacteria bacterium]
MECCVFIVVFIVLIASGAFNAKKNTSIDSSGDNVNLDDIFNDVMKLSNQRTGSSKALVTPPQSSQQQRRRSRNTPAMQQSPRQLMVTPTEHGSHNCEEVNYDKFSSLEGGTGSFNLGEPEPVVAYTQETKVKIGREDLLKSFIMSEVLQRYDINRIYSRIPPIKEDD